MLKSNFYESPKISVLRTDEADDVITTSAMDNRGVSFNETWGTSLTPMNAGDNHSEE